MAGASPLDICRHFKFGFCRYQERCRKPHVAEICTEENCEIESCSRRHPRACRYFESYKRCKFGEYCLYAHKVDPNTKEIEELKETLKLLNQKILAVEIVVTNLEKMIDKETENENGELKESHSNYSNICRTPITSSTLTVTNVNSTLNLPNPNSSPAEISPDFERIPQLDGGGSSRNVVQQRVKCDACRELFESQELLNEHMEIFEYGCEDCELCFSSEFEHDVHEHAVHPTEYFTYNKVSPRTKQKAIRYLNANM